MNEEQLKDLYKVTRGQIEHINNNISQRIIWLVIAQSFFFVGYATLIVGNPDNISKQSMQYMLIKLFPGAALVTVVFSFIDIVLSQVSLRTVIRHYYREKDRLKADNIYPYLNSHAPNKLTDNVVPLLMPLVFIGIWIFIMAQWGQMQQR